LKVHSSLEKKNTDLRSLNDKTRTRNETKVLQALAEELIVKYLPGEGLQEACHVDIVLFFQGRRDLKKGRGDWERLHDIALGRLESHASLCVGGGRLGGNRAGGCRTSSGCRLSRKCLASSFGLLSFSFQPSRFLVRLDLGLDTLLCFNVIQPLLLLLLCVLQPLFPLELLLDVLRFFGALPFDFLGMVLEYFKEIEAQ